VCELSTVLPTAPGHEHRHRHSQMALPSLALVAVAPPADPRDALLFAAIRADDVQQLERALSEGASVDSTVNVEEEAVGLLSAGPLTALMFAIALGRTRTTKHLLERGADVHAQRAHNGTTAMHIAAVFGNVEMVTVLTAAGSDVNAAVNDGVTPVCIAAQEGHAEVVRVLADLGARVKKTPDDGYTPVHIAAQEGHAEVIRRLAVLKADIVSPTKLGWTPLGLSVDGAHFEATKALLLLGVPITIEALKQCSNADGDVRQLRTDLQAWAADALVQHRIFQRTFLFGCSAHGELALTILEGEEALRAKVAEFVGVVVGKELRLTRAMGPAIAAIDWVAHDEQWPAPVG